MKSFKKKRLRNGSHLGLSAISTIFAIFLYLY